MLLIINIVECVVMYVCSACMPCKTKLGNGSKDCLGCYQLKYKGLFKLVDYLTPGMLLNM